MAAREIPTEPYEVFAVRYATHDRQASANFLGGDPHDGPMPIDYYVWLIRGNGREIVVDLGFNEAAAKARGRQLLRNPVEGLALLGCDAATVETVIVTHLHYDHVGNFDLFPRARFHLQDKEMAYATGRHMAEPVFNAGFNVEDVVGMVREVYKGRVVFHDGDAEIAPGVTLHHIGGHTAGMQSVRVPTRRGNVVLASDAAHFYANIEQVRPFPFIYHLGDMVDGFRRLYELADSKQHVVPGHDPLVLRRYPAPEPRLEGIVARLDVAPTE